MQMCFAHLKYQCICVYPTFRFTRDLAIQLAVPVKKSLLRACNSQMLETSCLNLVCGVLRVEGICTTKNNLSSTREHGATYA